MIETIVLSVVSAIMYAGVTYLRKSNGINGEEFNGVKFVTTIIIGGIVGILVGVTGVVPTESTVLEQITSLAGITVVIENLVKLAAKKMGWIQ